MVNYDLIKNTELRLLVTASESINSLPSPVIGEWIVKIANLPEGGQKEMISALRDEQLKMRSSKLERHITAEMEMQQIQKSAAALNACSQGFFAEVSKTNEKVSQNAEGSPENILQQL